MNGRTHALLGAASLAGSLGVGVRPTETLVLMGVAAGFALGPDIDHPNATISKTLPSIIHQSVHRAAELARNYISTQSDRKDSAWRQSVGIDPDHRGLTHTAAATLPVGLLALLILQVPLGVLIISGLASWWCLRLHRGLRPLCAVPVALCVVSPPSPGWVLTSVILGWLSHVLADACTKDGVPLLWPLKIKGKRFYRVRLLGRTLASGNRLEWLVAALLAMILNLLYIYV